MPEGNTSSSSSSGVGFIGLLTVALVVLKIMGFIGSWWFVFLPIILVTVIWLAIFAGVLGLVAWAASN